MNPSIILSVILLILGIIASLSGSDWFWWIMILFPILILIRLRKKIDFNGLIVIGVIVIFFGSMFISTGVMGMGDIIVFLYLFLFIHVICILLGIQKSKNDDISGFTIFGSIFAFIGMIGISSIMPTPLPVAPTTIPKVNTGSITNTGMMSTGTPYPLISR